MSASTEIATSNGMADALNSVFETINNIPFLDSPKIMAAEYLRNNKYNKIAAANSLIRWQNSKTFASGFLTNMGGFATLPISIPADISSLLVLQCRMVSSIAVMGGHDYNDDRVRSACFLCLCGNSVAEVAKGVAIQIGKGLTKKAIQSISRETIVQINKAVGFRMLTKFGTTGAINLGKYIPLISGAVGGTFNAVYTNQVGNAAIRVFLTDTLRDKCIAFYRNLRANILKLD